MAFTRLIRPSAVADSKTNKALSDIRAAVADHAALDGVRLIADVQLTSGETKRIAHGLGRKLRGWIVVRTSEGNTSAYLHDEQREHPDTDVYLHLRAEGYSPVVSLLVF